MKRNLADEIKEGFDSLEQSRQENILTIFNTIISRVKSLENRVAELEDKLESIKPPLGD